MDLLGRLDCVASVYRNAVYFIPTSSIITCLGVHIQTTKTAIDDQNAVAFSKMYTLNTRQWTTSK